MRRTVRQVTATVVSLIRNGINQSGKSTSVNLLNLRSCQRWAIKPPIKIKAQILGLGVINNATQANNGGMILHR